MIWRLLSAKTSLWVRWIHKYLIRKSSFWKVDEKSSLGSWTWKKLLKYRPIAAELTKVEIESGADTSFWSDVWCPLGRLSDLVGASGGISLGVRQDTTVEKAVQTYRQRRHRTEVLVQVEREILKLRERGLSNHSDTRLWKSKGDTYETSFSTKNTRNLVRTASPRCEWHKGVWFPFATPKYTFITWLAVHNRLSTGDRMIKWNQQANAACRLCDALMESRNHLFFDCVYSKEVWKRLTLNRLGTRYSSDWGAILRLLVDRRQDKIQLFLLRYTFQLTVYSVWRERNARRHGDKSQTVEKMCCYIDKGVRNRISTISKLGGKGYEEAMVRWFASR